MTMRREKPLALIEQWSPNFSQTICKELVHKSFLSEVFLTDSRQVANDCFLISALLPKTHFYYNDVPIRSQFYDSALILEVCRQVSIYIAHIFYAISFDYKFIFDSANFTQYLGHKPANNIDKHKAIIHTKVINKKTKKDSLCGLEIDMMVYIDQELYACKSMKFSWVAPKMWDKLRRISQQQDSANLEIKPILKDIVCKEHISNVVIGNFLECTNYFQATIIADKTHPAFFDHPLDHISGILIIEAIKQFGIATCAKVFNCKPTKLQFKSIQVEFKNFCEFYNPNICYVSKEHICLQDGEISMDIVIKSAKLHSVSSSVKFIMGGGR